MTRKMVRFTPEELGRLTAATREGAAAIVKLWDALRAIEQRIPLDWEPDERSCSDILDLLAFGLSTPEDAARITPETVQECFGEPEDWHAV